MTVAASGEYRAALEALPRLHALAVDAKQPLIRSLFHIIAGVIHHFGLDYRAALREHDLGMELAQQAGDQMYIYLGSGMRAWTESFLGMHEQAKTDRQRSIQIADAMGGRLMYADWFDAVDVDCAFNAGRFEEALERAMSVSTTARAAGQIMSQGVAERVLGKALSRDAARAEEADRHFARSIEVSESGGLVLEIAHTRVSWGEVLRARGLTDAAAEQFRQALNQFELSGCDVACQRDIER
jgi:tetratricopeptide (TPR) repeat protein